MANDVQEDKVQEVKVRNIDDARSYAITASFILSFAFLAGSDEIVSALDRQTKAEKAQTEAIEAQTEAIKAISTQFINTPNAITP